MTLQGNLHLNYNGQTYLLAVKSILLKGVYYFFIHEPEERHDLLSGETLQLVYSGEFINPAEVEGGTHKTSPEIITAIEGMLMENKELWYY
ncbi:MAG: hypothetical protein V4725_04715 [Bacteroidota bacterium]|nr:hypothetical protein [Ferruginibacter sp.]